MIFTTIVFLAVALLTLVVSVFVMPRFDRRAPVVVPSRRTRTGEARVRP